MYEVDAKQTFHASPSDALQQALPSSHRALQLTYPQRRDPTVRTRDVHRVPEHRLHERRERLEGPG